MYFDRFDFVTLCMELYDPHELGAIALRSVLPRRAAWGISSELSYNTRNFVKRPEEYGTTRQTLSSWSIEWGILLNYPYLGLLRECYEELSELMHCNMGVSQRVDKKTVNANFYAAGCYGIGPHRDNTFSVNFTAVFISMGRNPFSVARDKKRMDEKQLVVEPGDIILMRAPRTEDEKDLRPVHYVENIVADRYSITFREINLLQQHRVDRNQRYNSDTM